MNFATDYISRLKNLLDDLDTGEIDKIVDVLYDAYSKDKTVFLIGNGGSAALASHMACDLGKGTFAPKHVPLPGIKRFKALSLTDNVPMISAWANDTAYDRIFAEQLENFVQSGDVLFGISGSGNSPNVLNAFEVARKRHAVTVGLSGFDGGKLKGMVDHAIIVRSDSMQQIEDMHIVIAHIIFLELQRKICAGVKH